MIDRSPNEDGTFTLKPHATALTVAGSDPSGGAGLQADLKTFQQLQVYGMSVVTLLTAQNTVGVQSVHVMTPDLVLAQLDSVLSDITPNAIKTGAMGDASIVEAVANRLRGLERPIVVDPVLVSKHGHKLASDDVVEAFRKELLPLATLVTPNRYEAERLTGLSLTDERSAAESIQILHELGAKFVLLKLGADAGKSSHLLGVGDQNLSIKTPLLTTNNTHGTGCILSAAITASFALGESDLEDAVMYGIQRTHEAIHVNTEIGKGIHPAETRAMGYV